jgi:transposase
MWTTENRHRYDRDKLRYPSDLTDAEWQLVEPLIPPAKRGGGKRTVNNARGGERHHVCAEHRVSVAVYSEGPAAAQHSERLFLPVGLGRHAGEDPSRALPEMPGPGGARSQPDRLRNRQPEREERRKSGSGIDPHGFDAGKLIKGKKRHVLVDILGPMLHALVTAADVQDREGGVLLLALLWHLYDHEAVRYQAGIQRSVRCVPICRAGRGS